MAACPPGASGVVPELGCRNSPTAPLTAVICPSIGARSTVLARSRSAFCTPTRALSTAACAASSWLGRSAEEASSWFWVMTRPLRACSTCTRPEASSICFLLRAWASWLSAWATPCCAIAAWLCAPGRRMQEVLLCWDAGGATGGMSAGLL